tara:strand:- start:1162 stop:1320 length:159 start_codon:yes stop_codon:yes gene_type:complete
MIKLTIAKSFNFSNKSSLRVISLYTPNTASAMPLLSRSATAITSTLTFLPVG